MQIKLYTRDHWRLLVRCIVLGSQLTWLVLTITACDTNDPVSLFPDQTIATPQLSTSTISAPSASSPTIIKVEPATLTAVPTNTIEIMKSPPAETAVPIETAVPTALPSLPPPSSTVTSPIPTPIPPTITPTSTAVVTEETPPYLSYVIGQSSRGFPLTAYQFNDGPQHIIIVGGIHGGYEWNTIILAYELIDYFTDHPTALPDTVTLTIIPSANPDGQEIVTGGIDRFTGADVAPNTVPGRFNGNNVDLNRNWDCQWAPTALWRGNIVSGGDQPFSEPETIVLRDFLLQRQPQAVIFLHSAANGVFASGCPGTHQPSMDLVRIYAEASGYPAYERFSAYEVTGDAGDWLTTYGITSISIELKNHENSDRDKNIAGTLAVLEHYK